MFGRDGELASAVAFVEGVLAGSGGLLLVTGEAGIGKTRTAQELAAHAAGEGAAVLWGRCPEESGAPPYWPWVQVIRAALQDANPDFLAELGASAGDLADLVPEVRDRVPGLERSAPLGDPAEARFRMFESIRHSWPA